MWKEAFRDQNGWTDEGESETVVLWLLPGRDYLLWRASSSAFDFVGALCVYWEE